MHKNYGNQNKKNCKQISWGLTEVFNCPGHQWPFPDNPQDQFTKTNKSIEQMDKHINFSRAKP